ncbi:uncharacterized protein HD556DRAFT_1312043 [Suillus plorans]|uniref:Uncharacterized protein n=1 Tax=Suillus plorans TaxID=116603 RepID=A0A9P7AFM9_9AGAM|nr:uncharacterized protein HD556DRAFT_1312043 [Suillus plorans]KAG1788455.1 hypothetical protein HD556DRAFT_1312043 [Suillus plorans]
MENGDSKCWESERVGEQLSTTWILNNARGQSNIYVKVAVEYFGSKVHVNKHEALRTMGKHVIVLATIGASKTGQDTDRTSARENIGSNARETSGPSVKASGPMPKRRIEREVIIVQWALDMNRESVEYEPSASSSATPRSDF